MEKKETCAMGTMNFRCNSSMKSFSFTILFSIPKTIIKAECCPLFGDILWVFISTNFPLGFANCEIKYRVSFCISWRGAY